MDETSILLISKVKLVHRMEETGREIDFFLDVHQEIVTCISKEISLDSVTIKQVAFLK